MVLELELFKMVELEFELELTGPELALKFSSDRPVEKTGRDGTGGAKSESVTGSGLGLRGRKLETVGLRLGLSAADDGRTGRSVDAQTGGSVDGWTEVGRMDGPSDPMTSEWLTDDRTTEEVAGRAVVNGPLTSCGRSRLDDAMTSGGADFVCAGFGCAGKNCTATSRAGKTCTDERTSACVVWSTCLATSLQQDSPLKFSVG